MKIPKAFKNPYVRETLIELAKEALKAIAKTVYSKLRRNKNEPKSF